MPSKTIDNSDKTTPWRLIVGTAVTLLSTILFLAAFPPLELVENKLYDADFRIRGPLKPPEEIVIAAIDEKSLERLGRWPWSREVISRLIDRLAAADAAVVGMDIIFAEKDLHDGKLAESIRAASNVILPLVFDFTSGPPPRSDELTSITPLTAIRNPGHLAKYPPITAHGALLPVEALRDNSMAVGHINMLPDRDGTVRWESLVISYMNSFYPSLSLQMASAYLGIPQQQILIDAGRNVEAGPTTIPTDAWGRTAINYYGPGGTFTHIPIVDILDGTAPAERLANSIVLVGATAVGIYDLRVTPFSAAMPGVEKHASVIASILEKRFIRKASRTANLLILVTSGLLLTFTMTRVRLIGSIIVTLLILLVLTTAAIMLFANAGLFINLAYPSCNLIGIFVGITACNYALEEKRARKIRAMFSSYVTQTIVNELIQNPEMAKLGGELREVTILFADIKNFTTYANRHSPEEVVSVLNEYLGAMTDIILKWEGTLDKFIGDAIVVFWGAPLRSQHHPLQAVHCAMEMAATMEKLGLGWAEEGKTPLSAGIGINTGQVLVGNIGAEGKKMDYTIIGDHVNICARVESLTRRYDFPILITGNTVEALRGETDLRGVVLRGIERVIVKGREEPVAIYGLETACPPSSPALIIDCPEVGVVQLLEK